MGKNSKRNKRQRSKSSSTGLTPPSKQTVTMDSSTTQPHYIAQANESIYGMNSLTNPSMNLCETYPSNLQSVSNTPGHPPFFNNRILSRLDIVHLQYPVDHSYLNS
jgi:hypothetical protein